MGQLDHAAEGRRAGERHLPSIARAGQLRPIEAGNEVRHGLVCGAAFNQQYARALPVHSQQPAALHLAGRQQQCPRGSVASGLPARRAIHGQRPVSAGHQEQGGADRDLGARERERHRLHERPTHGNGDWTTSADRHRRPGRKSVYHRALSTDRQRHAAAHPTRKPVRDRGDDTDRRRPRSRDAASAAAVRRRSAPQACSTPTMERRMLRPSSEA